MRKVLKKYMCAILIMEFMVLTSAKTTVYATDDELAEAKNGIVVILSGFIDSKGEFFCIKTSSGFLINNSDGEAYLLTANHCVAVTDEEKSDYCTSNGLEVDISNVQNRAKVVVKGDVTSDVSIVAQSAESDYCILRTSNVINEKVPLKLGNSRELTTGMKVYAMGFENDSVAERTELTAIDVIVREGSLQNLESNQEGVIYQQHSAKITEDNSGGPLLSADGYVIGINNSAKSRPEEGAYFSFPINEIREVLDNYNIDYCSIEKITAGKKLDSMYIEGRKKYESGDYKKNSLIDLENAILQVEELKKQEISSEEDIKVVSANLEAAIKKLQKKMPVKEKIMIGFGVISFLLFLSFFYVMCIYRKEKRLLEKDEKNIGVAERVTEDVDMRSPNKTTLLSDSEKQFLTRDKEAVLVQLKGAKSIGITKQVMSIGKGAQKVDIFVEGNPAVSRMHAQITWKNQNYYIRDLGSANGTFLNDKQIPPYQDKNLKNGDKLKLANEEFEFKELG